MSGTLALGPRCQIEFVRNILRGKRCHHLIAKRHEADAAKEVGRLATSLNRIPNSVYDTKARIAARPMKTPITDIPIDPTT